MARKAEVKEPVVTTLPSTAKSAYQIILRPIVTEKSVMISNEKNGKYVFEVAKGANKYEIAAAVEKIQADLKNKITVISVNTVKTPGKMRRGRFFRRASQGYSSGYRKAIVTLAEGQQIELVEGV
jgi:large subunit ribosomal protein L23